MQAETKPQLMPIVREFSRWAIMILAVVGIAIMLMTIFSDGAVDLSIFLKYMGCKSGYISSAATTTLGKIIILFFSWLFGIAGINAYRKDLKRSLVPLALGWAMILG